MDPNYRKFFVKLTLDGDNNKVIEASDCNVAFIMKAHVTVLYSKQAKKHKMQLYIIKLCYNKH